MELALQDPNYGTLYCVGKAAQFRAVDLRYFVARHPELTMTLDVSQLFLTVVHRWRHKEDLLLY
jgi:hypothetical protein